MKITFTNDELYAIMTEYFQNNYKVNSVTVDSHEGEVYMDVDPITPFGIRKPEKLSDRMQRMVDIVKTPIDCKVSLDKIDP